MRLRPPVAVRAAYAGDAAALAAMCAALWPGTDAAGHLDEIPAKLESGDAALWLAEDADGQVLGFAEASLRHDYVNGTETSPVGYLEALYVRPEARRCGIGRSLVAAVEHWTRERGCSELASDADLDNRASHAAHAAYGFGETERVVYFRKRLAP